LKIKQLKDLGIKVTPNVFEWIVDIFEKTAINDAPKQSLEYLTEKFKERAPEHIKS